MPSFRLVRTSLESCPERGGALAALPLLSLPGSPSPSSEHACARECEGRGGQLEEEEEEGEGRKKGWKAGGGILGSLCSDPYPSVLL